MSKKTTTMNSGEGLNQDLTDWKRLDAMTDSDIAELNADFFKNTEVLRPPEKKHVSIRLDADVLEWMKSQGKGYQSRINPVLRAYYEVHHSER